MDIYTVKFGRKCTVSQIKVSFPISNWYGDWNPKGMHLASTHQDYVGTRGDQPHSNW